MHVDVDKKNVEQNNCTILMCQSQTCREGAEIAPDKGPRGIGVVEGRATLVDPRNKESDTEGPRHAAETNDGIESASRQVSKEAKRLVAG
jgi:hypothetical protein